ncbi:YggT family protein [Paenibacillus alkaliterrae]|uniref:YggT family protein n=1 Tax=Paenibacillus alkaliterrae TaxID=320909 RepID=UPI001F38BDCA|nr:YggT family protein [Paenibacillus alkaliterrae]MCF2939302.1 YggT family protein [Paenibacillus alkaliterrae]
MMDIVASTVMNVQRIYTFMIIGYVLLSWLPNARESFIGVFLGKLVEPYLGIFRKFIPPIGGMLDLSPILAVFALQFVAYGLIAVIGFFIN